MKCSQKNNTLKMVGRMGGGLYFSVEIELQMSKIPPFTNRKFVHNVAFQAHPALVKIGPIFVPYGLKV